MTNSKYYYYDKCTCGKNKCTKSKHCKSCANLKKNRKLSTLRKISKSLKGKKHWWKGFEGKHHTKQTKEKIGLSKKGIPLLEITKKRISKGLKKAYNKQNGRMRIKQATIIKHHINNNHNDNRKENMMFLTMREHTKLHQEAYKYLVKIGLIKSYIKWFLKQIRD